MENLSRVSGGCLAIGGMCLAYFLVKAFAEEKFSAFSFAWAFLFISCGLLIFFSLVSPIVAYIISLIIFFGAVLDFFIVMGKEQRKRLLFIVISLCLGCLFVFDLGPRYTIW